MSDLSGLNIAPTSPIGHLLRTHDHAPLYRIFAFLNLTIEDVYTHPVAATAVEFHWRVHRLVERRCAAIDAEHILQRRIAGDPLPTDDLEDALSRSAKPR